MEMSGDWVGQAGDRMTIDTDEISTAVNNEVLSTQRAEIASDWLMSRHS